MAEEIESTSHKFYINNVEQDYSGPNICSVTMDEIKLVSILDSESTHTNDTIPQYGAIKIIGHSVNGTTTKPTSFKVYEYNGETKLSEQSIDLSNEVTYIVQNANTTELNLAGFYTNGVGSNSNTGIGYISIQPKSNNNVFPNEKQDTDVAVITLPIHIQNYQWVVLYEWNNAMP